MLLARFNLSVVPVYFWLVLFYCCCNADGFEFQINCFGKSLNTSSSCRWTPRPVTKSVLKSQLVEFEERDWKRIPLFSLIQFDSWQRTVTITRQTILIENTLGDIFIIIFWLFLFYCDNYSFVLRYLYDTIYFENVDAEPNFLNSFKWYSCDIQFYFIYFLFLFSHSDIVVLACKFSLIS